jgi:hypothetical protein
MTQIDADDIAIHCIPSRGDTWVITMIDLEEPENILVSSFGDLIRLGSVGSSNY